MTVIFTEYIIFFLMLLLVAAALSVFIFEDLLYVVIIFGGYSTIMSLIWQQLTSPDIAITEAAVGIGVAILMITVVTKVGRRPQ